MIHDPDKFRDKYTIPQAARLQQLIGLDLDEALDRIVAGAKYRTWRGEDGRVRVEVER